MDGHPALSPALGLSAILDAPPSGMTPGPDWFDQIAARLMDHSVLIAGDTAHRIIELEFYYSGPGHRDPFTHGDALQRQSGTWYLHRTAGHYRGGSFKGLDLTFGRVGFGGVLIRSLRASDGTVVSGSSLCVDRILSCTDHRSVAALDSALKGRWASDPGSVLHLRAQDGPTSRCWRTARVGLTLKRAAAHPEMPRYLLRPYRYVTAPRAVRKGRVQLALAMLAAGRSPAEVHRDLGTPLHHIARYRAAVAEGRRLSGLDPFLGRALSSDDLCRLHGFLSQEA